MSVLERHNVHRLLAWEVVYFLHFNEESTDDLHPVAVPDRGKQSNKR